MKNFTLLFLIGITNFMTSQNFEKEWKEVDDLMQKRLPKSAYEKANSIFEKSITSANQEQIVKSIFYLQGIKSELDEIQYDSKSQKEIQFNENEINKVNGSAKSILLSFLAQKYSDFLNQNYYKLQKRTEAIGETELDIAKWSMRDVEKKIQTLYLSSCEDVFTKEVSIADYKALISNSTSKYVKTLYDFLHLRAINGLSNERHYLQEPEEPFILKREQLIDLEKFALLTLTEDSNSSKYQVLKLYQKLIKEHIVDKDPTILIDIELRRLEFIFNNYDGDYKERIYTQLLENLFNKYKKSSEAYYALLKIGQILQGQAGLYNQSRDSSLQWKNKEAIAIYDQIIRECADNNIVHQAKNAKNGILQNNQLNVDNEKVYLPGKPILAKINYTNIQKIYYRIYPKVISPHTHHEYYNDQRDYFQRLMKGTQVESGSFDLNDPGDFMSHSTEVDLPPLKSGNYVLLLSQNQNFSVSNNILVASGWSVSNIAYFVQQSPLDIESDIYVVDRYTGHPLLGAKVDIYQRVWENVQKTVLVKTMTTYIDGKITLSTPLNQSLNYFFQIEYKGDKLLEMQDHYFYHDGYQSQANIQDNYQLFLDREIYRPGQLIYFKGIAYQTSNKNAPKSLINKPIELIFKDANWQDIEKKTFTTNEYGTFHGSLTIPSSGILGVMHLQVNGGYMKPFRVEEYKRPSFEVVIDSSKDSYRLGDKVKISAKGMAYSGASIPNAKYKYRITRQTHYPFWRCWWMPYPREEKQIAQGKGTTDQNGKLDFSFVAEKGRDNPWDKNPVYIYNIRIEMMDVSGETQTATSSISLSTVDFQIETTLKETYSPLEKIQIPIRIVNLSGSKISKNYEVKIEKLIDPSILFQKRYWEYPEWQLLSEKEFKSKFPDIAYRNEDQIEAFKISNLVFEGKYNSVNPSIQLNSSTWKKGAYKMSISALDNLGKPIHIEKYFYLKTVDEPLTNSPAIFAPIQSEYEPGKPVTLNLISPSKDQKYIFSLLQNQLPKRIAWSQSQKTQIAWNISEQDRGGAYLLWTTVWNNRIYSNKEFLPVPWTNKELEIEYISFRDKLEPGQQEEWKMKIKGKRGDKIMAEVLANLYDQSLDIFAKNEYSFFPYTNFNENTQISSFSFSHKSSDYNLYALAREKYLEVVSRIYPELIYPNSNHFGIYQRNRRGLARSSMKQETMMDAAAPVAMSAVVTESIEEKSVKFKGGKDQSQDYSADDAKATGTSNRIAASSEEKKRAKDPKSEIIKVRTNLNETVFFKPDIKTDADGNLILSFKMNEALTKWKLMILALTKDLRIGSSERSVVTQKTLMIQPNAPRFLRENDQIYFASKITNLSDKKLDGIAHIELTDAIRHKNINILFGLQTTQQNFSIDPGQTKSIDWKLNVPEGVSALQYRVIAKAENFSDGEENAIPVLSDKMLVTETMPFQLRSGEKQNLEFLEMKEKISSTTLRSKVFKLEYTSNPMWYAIQAIPYLMEYPYECTEQIFNRYFANTVSSHIIRKYPKIQSVFHSWKGTDAMISNLSKNHTLKSALLEETPWVLAAQSEEEQRKNIAILFDIYRIGQEQNIAVDKLVERQISNGAFPWFPGGYESPYITQNLLEGFGHLRALGAMDDMLQNKTTMIIQKAIPYLDAQIVKHYREMEESLKRYGGKLEDDHLDPYALHYLYTRSYFSDEMPKETEKVKDYYHKQGLKYWTKRSLFEQGMLALYYHRDANMKSGKKSPDVIVNMMKSFRERAKVNEEKGMYWDIESGYWWYQLPIETHSLMVEVFENLSEDQREKDNLKLWLIKNKQTNRWSTTKSTASAIFALLGGKSDKLELPTMPKIRIANEQLVFQEKNAEQGTGYIQKTWNEEEIKPEFSKIEVENSNSTIGWGALYWQYLEKLSAIKINTSSPLRVEKKIFIVQNTDQGEKMQEVTSSNDIALGDKMRTRLILKVEREMEFLHLKDMRAAGLEPLDAMSGYKWSGGLGYYQTTRDASMNFFIDRIQKGTYIIEYDVFANSKGKFSNGISTFQSMYAPEFNSHSDGIELEVK